MSDDNIPRPPDIDLVEAAVVQIRLARFCLDNGWFDTAEHFAHAVEVCLTWAGASDNIVPPSNAANMPGSYNEILEWGEDDDDAVEDEIRQRAINALDAIEDGETPHAVTFLHEIVDLTEDKDEDEDGNDEYTDPFEDRLQRVKAASEDTDDPDDGGSDGC